MGTLRVDPGVECKRRVAAIKSQLPKGVKAIITKEHSEYDTIAGGRLIDNVIAGKSSDLKLTEILEEIAKPKKGGRK